VVIEEKRGEGRGVRGGAPTKGFVSQKNQFFSNFKLILCEHNIE